MLALWCNRVISDVPDSILNKFEEGFCFKTSTSPVRSAYIGVLSACCHSRTADSIKKFIPLLLKSIEKAVAQSAQVSYIRTQAVAISFLL